MAVNTMDIFTQSEIPQPATPAQIVQMQKDVYEKVQKEINIQFAGGFSFHEIVIDLRDKYQKEYEDHASKGHDALAAMAKFALNFLNEYKNPSALYDTISS